MQLQITEHLPAHFSDESTVWIYQCNRLFTIEEAFEIETMLRHFVENWKSHGAVVGGYANIFYGQFIILMADTTKTGVSGCSTDSSVQVIKQIEKQFGVNMFDRQMLAFLIKDKVQLLPLAQLSYGIANGFIDKNTLYFNNTINTKRQLMESWPQPISDSWLANKVK